MRRKLFCIALILSILVLVLLPFQTIVRAEDRSYTISQVDTVVRIGEDGSAYIKERITYRFSGHFNGVLRDIDFAKTGGLEEVRVFVERNGSEVEWERNTGNSLNDTGDPGTYNYEVDGNLAHLKVFEPSDNEEKTFVYTYKLLDIITLYSDTAEFNHHLVDRNSQVVLENINLLVRLPEGISREQIQAFAHGPLTGEIVIGDDSSVSMTVPAVSPGEYVEAHILFPPSFVPNARNFVQEEALPRILEEEKQKAEEANRVREEARQQVREQQAREQQEFERRMEEQRKRDELRAAFFPLAAGLGVILFAAWFVLILYIYQKYDRELSHSFQGKYYRELPGKYTPAETSVLMSFGSVQTRDAMATLMDLIRKKQLLLQVSKVMQKGLFKSKEVEVYTFALNDKAPAIQLKKHEAFLISWFIGKIGNGLSVTLDEINEYVRSRGNALEFRSDYREWESCVVEEAQKNRFFDSTSRQGRLLGVLSGLGYLLAGGALTMLFASPLLLLLAIQGVILMIFSARINRRTSYGNEQHAMWQAFTNFLRDFSRMEKAVIPSIVIWEHYLVYAISLGVARDVIRQLPLVFSGEELDHHDLTFMHGASYGYFYGFTHMFDHTMDSVQSAITTAASIANSSNSSSSGSGGGFSGGSSGGGGGGGGHGAF